MSNRGRWLIGLATLLATLSAFAQPGWGGPGHRRAMEERPALAAPPPPMFQSPEFPRGGPPPGFAPPRLSPEERRQLRRDIRDAGQDLYRRDRGRREF